MIKKCMIAISIVLIFAPRFTAAGVIAINSFDRGWYATDGNHIVNNDNYLAYTDKFPNGTLASDSLNNFFVFDLSGLTAVTITNARLELYNPQHGYFSQSTTATYQLWDVSTPVSSLTNGSVNAFSDLGSGISFGSTSVSSLNDDTFLSITLNGNAVTSINASIGSNWAVGGSLDSLPGIFSQIFRSSETGNPSDGRTRIVLDATTVPEPSSLLLFSIAATFSVSQYVRRHRSVKCCLVAEPNSILKLQIAGFPNGHSIAAARKE